MRHAEAPLYNPSFEHDACGVGFVADAGARSRDRVLPLALAGLSSLAHRGAFGADGRSSDGAGIALPLERSIWELVDGGRGTAGQAIIGLFLPRSSRAQTAARRLVERALADERLVCRRWRAVPVYPDVLGPEARASLPAIFQVVVRAASPVSGRRDLDQRLLLARRRMEIQAERSRITEFAVTSASSRSVVYKGLVAGGSLAAFYPDLAQPIEVSHATFHQRYATNTRPRWPLAQPFRLVAHNGEINTVRGNREQVRGRAGTLGGRFGARVAALGPLLSEDGSDSLSLDELLDLMVAAGWSLEAALLAAIPEAQGLRVRPHPEIIEFQRRLAGRLAPWDGPAAIVFSDGRRVGAILDRNGLRPAAYAVTSHGIVTLASEAGAVPLTAAETVERGRLGPGEMLLVEPGRGRLWHDEEAKREALRGHIALPLPSVARAPSGVIANRSGMIDPATVVPSPDNAQLPIPSPTDIGMRWLYGLDAERLRLSIKSMAMEGTEPLWSMGDDTPLPGLSRKDRPVTDHLRQSFAQVTNPAIDPERERIVMDLRVDLGRRPALLRPRPGQPFTLSLAGSVLARPDELLDAFKELRGTDRLSTLDTTWRPSGGGAELDAALTQLGERAVRLSRRGVELLVLDDRRLARGGVASAATLPSVLAAGAVHTALTRAGLRGRTDLVVVAADLLDVHSVAMALAAGATAVSPWLAVELAAEFAGGRGVEHLTAEGARANLVTALEKGLRKVLARMGISCLASYIGGQFFEVLELSDEIAERCFPAAPRWAGRVGFEALASRQQRRLAQALAFTPMEKLPDPGFARFRADGEGHLYAPSIVRAVQGVAAPDGADPAVAAETLRIALGREPALVRDQLAVRRSPNPGPLDEVEPAEAIMRRFVSAAMSLGALSPESHQAVTLGMRMAGGASNSGEGGEDPAWYVEVDGRRHDAAIKQVASARFGVTATYLSRAEQLEIKIAQGSKPGEGGQLPGRKVTPLIAALRRGQPGQSMISPPPHHDIYSIEDLAQLIADLRAINPGARIGVKLVAALGVGTIAAGVAKAGADYVQISGHSGGTGASPLSSIKHAGIPWELGLAEVHQVLLRNGLRDRVSLRTDGGLQTGRDVVIAALLGAEEFGFGTALLVALGCDMARQCHLDTCPTGIATQRDDLRQKFTGRPEAVERLLRHIAEETRRELAAAGLSSIGDALGKTRHLRLVRGGGTLELSRLLRAPAWEPGDVRRGSPRAAQLAVERAPASAVEYGLSTELLHLPSVEVRPGPPFLEHADHGTEDREDALPTVITTADRSFGAHVSGLIERGLVRRPIRWRLAGAAGQSFGAFAGPLVDLELIGQANDYVAKGLSGGRVVVRPEAELSGAGRVMAMAGNTCLYGATSGRLHIVGSAGMRFAIRNSGAEAVVEGIGAHGCEYMTGGTVVVLGPTGRNFGAGMTGGRAYLHDPSGAGIPSLDRASVVALRLGSAVADRADGLERLAELHRLLLDHRDAGSVRARKLLASPAELADEIWLVEPIVRATEERPAEVQRRPIAREELVAAAHGS